jgi:hypothetical protein
VFFPGYKPFGFDPELQFEESLLYCLPRRIAGNTPDRGVIKIKMFEKAILAIIIFVPLTTID